MLGCRLAHVFVPASPVLGTFERRVIDRFDYTAPYYINVNDVAGLVPVNMGMGWWHPYFFADTAGVQLLFSGLKVADASGEDDARSLSQHRCQQLRSPGQRPPRGIAAAAMLQSLAPAPVTFTFVRARRQRRPAGGGAPARPAPHVPGALDWALAAALTNIVITPAMTTQGRIVRRRCVTKFMIYPYSGKCRSLLFWRCHHVFGRHKLLLEDKRWKSRIIGKTRRQLILK